MPVFASFFAQVTSPLILILLTAAIVSFALGRRLDSIVILLVVVVNSTFATFWEIRAKSAIASLKKFLSPKAKVIRNGAETEIPIKELKIGDMVLIEAGDRVPADGVLKQSTSLQIDESAITGESIPVEKKTGSEVFAGTAVVVGSGIFKTEKTGEATQIGQIAKSVVSHPEVVTPLQKKVAALGKFLAVILLVISAITFLLGIVSRYDSGLMFTTAVALAVSAVPEGLPVAVTVVLAFGVVKMAKNRAIVAKLVSVEALGSVTTIATDKTGTLTKGEIQANKVYLTDQKLIADVSNLTQSESLKRLLIAGVLCNNARIRKDDQLQIIGDRLEAALLTFAEKFNLNWSIIRNKFPKVAEFPFDPKFRYMATLHQVPDSGLFSGKQVFFVKGAPKEVAALCDSQLDREEIERIADKLAKQGLRVLAIATHQIRESWAGIEKEKVAGKLTLLGLVGFADEIRPETAETIQKLKDARINILMVTGDHELTALHIAQEAGMLDGKKVASWSENKQQEILAKISDLAVIARVPPAAKMEIVKKLQRSGEIVAMTGDGVNDGPALVAADVGVALGRHGTDLAKGVADIVLTDDNLRTLYTAVVTGRVIFENIRKIVVYLLADSFGAIITTVGAILIGLPLPLLPTQILWINLVTDSLPDIALAAEPAEPKIFASAPAKNSQILELPHKVLVFLIGVVSGLAALAVFTIILATSSNLEYARTVTFATMGANTLIYVFSVRSLSSHFWQINLLSNKFLLASIVGGFFILALGIYLPPLQLLFATIPLGFFDWLFVGTVCLIVVTVIELAKTFFVIEND